MYCAGKCGEKELGGLGAYCGDFLEVKADVDGAGLGVDGKKIIEGVCTLHGARCGLDDDLTPVDRGGRRLRG